MHLIITWKKKLNLNSKNILSKFELSVRIVIHITSHHESIWFVDWYNRDPKLKFSLLFYI